MIRKRSRGGGGEERRREKERNNSIGDEEYDMEKSRDLLIVQFKIKSENLKVRVIW